MMSFAELCSQFHATTEERDALAWHLAMFRARKTYNALRAVEEGEAK